MPAKKNQKAKLVKKKTAPKVKTKAAVKTKAKPKAKAPVKTKKVAIPVKKIKAKAVKTAKKIVKKVAPKITPKKEKKVAKKPELKKVKAIKEVVKTKAEKNAKPDKKDSLAKRILATHSTKKSSAKEELSTKVEIKPDLNQRTLIVRKSDNKNKTSFKVGDYAVYPSHGIGKIVDIEKTNILGQEFKCYIMYFEKERLNIKIPMNSADKIGLRPLISKSQMDEVFVILRSGVKKLKGMWSRRAQEYETKINSGDIMLLAEVLRDLTRDIEDSERSYSERIIYETAIYRLATEYAVIYGIDVEEAKQKVITVAKDKLGSEIRVNQKDEFDEFDADENRSGDDEDDEDDDDDEEEEEEDDDFDYNFDDEDDEDAPKKKRKK